MIDFMAGDPDAVVEPWQPKVGDRVLVHVSPECPAVMQCYDDRTNEPLDQTTGHFPEENGRTGTVVSADLSVPMLTTPDHHYAVRYDYPFAMGNGYQCSHGAHAACELEPLA